tara:strand:+ start:219 stop:374 length:156 start_codon:yes stop_codon:yes gene_type:complete
MRVEDELRVVGNELRCSPTPSILRFIWSFSARHLFSFALFLARQHGGVGGR